VRSESKNIDFGQNLYANLTVWDTWQFVKSIYRVQNTKYKEGLISYYNDF